MNKYAQKNYFERELCNAQKEIIKLKAKLEKHQNFKPIDGETWSREHPEAIKNTDMLDLRFWVNPNNPIKILELEKLMREIFDIIVYQHAQGETCITDKVYVEIFNEPKRE